MVIENVALGQALLPEGPRDPIFDRSHNNRSPKPYFAVRFLRPYDLALDAALSHLFFSFLCGALPRIQVQGNGHSHYRLRHENKGDRGFAKRDAVPDCSKTRPT